MTEFTISRRTTGVHSGYNADLDIRLSSSPGSAGPATSLQINHPGSNTAVSMTTTASVSVNKGDLIAIWVNAGGSYPLGLTGLVTLVLA